MNPRFTYVVMCHHKAEQALRLARAIRDLSPSATVLLRHDRPHGYITASKAAEAGADLHVSELRPRWGRWSLVAAALEAFDVARRRHRPDWVVLVSGQDYPVRPLAAWEAELAASPVDAVVTGTPLVTGPLGWRFRAPEDRTRMRYTHRWSTLPTPGLVPRLPTLLRRAVRHVWYGRLFELQALVVLNELPRDEGWILGLRRRSVPFDQRHPAFKGSQWLALSATALTLVSSSPEATSLQRYFARTLIPDESYFRTVLARFPTVRVSPGPVSWHLWHDDVRLPHPTDVGLDDLDQAMASGAPFARKFDEARAPEVLDRLDARLREAARH